VEQKEEAAKEEGTRKDGARKGGVRKGGAKITALRYVSDILLTLALICALFIFWQLYWTGLEAEKEQSKAISAAKWDMPPEMKVAKPEAGDPPVLPQPSGENAMIGRVYIPVFGKDYSRPIVEGTNKERVLDKMGFGHYENTAMPGGIGNFAAAAHRDGYGEPLGEVERIMPGDSLIIRTEHYWYVYDATESLIVDPSDSSVLLPVPNHPDEQPKERLLTFTTCHPRYTAEKRYIVHGKFSYWAKVINGIPKEMKDAGFIIED
jgi:LPXTG-site transpeptidase (sortase) family protein